MMNKIYIVTEYIPDSKEVKLATLYQHHAAESFMENYHHREIEIWIDDKKVGLFSYNSGDKPLSIRLIVEALQKYTPTP
jgi:hypothetical protein